ncbi:MAG: 1-deoxy-D-xylulose-5-phosphate reductoisomerase [Alphaproteobacteria bacterium]|nr:1-deoxy-D-xylulose-5-phosphate reductoisomerase [Alphaproteobacteria bacterium]
MTNKVTIFGSTGSIGKQALDVISHSTNECFSIQALTANQNYTELAKQINKFKPKYAVINDTSKLDLLNSLLNHSETKILTGAEGMVYAAQLDNDQVIAGISGSAGLHTTYLALTTGANVLFANKESLVCAGNLLKTTEKKSGSKLIPLDSEHNAIFQVFEEANRKSIDKIILTASGGPFREKSKLDLENVTIDQALKHPNWNMGKKITIDCATLFNKGLEVIEAHYLFDMPVEKIDVVIHPESTIHSMVQYKDGSTLAQLGNPDMRTPICHGLYWPNRYSGHQIVENLNFFKLKQLNFEEPNNDLFPSLTMCKHSVRLGKSFPMALNASNEIAVDYFLNGRIKFTDIFKLVEMFLERHKPQDISSIEAILKLDKELKLEARNIADSQICS